MKFDTIKNISLLSLCITFILISLSSQIRLRQFPQYHWNPNLANIKKEYETQKTQFFQTLKIQNEIEKKKDNEKKKEDKIKNDEKEQKEPIKMKENNKKESNYINNNGNLKNHSKSINPKEDSQNTNNASRFEMKKITIVPQKLYRNDIDFNQDYKNPTPGGPDIVKKEEKNVNNSENSTQSNSKININMSNIPSLYNNNKNQFRIQNKNYIKTANTILMY